MGNFFLFKNRMTQKFKVEFLPEAVEFMDSLD